MICKYIYRLIRKCFSYVDILYVYKYYVFVMLIEMIDKII